MRKRGSTLTIENTVSIVIVVILVIALVFLIRAMYPSSYEPGKEYSKAQIKEIEEKLMETEETGMPQEHLIIAAPKDSRCFLVYFENENFVESMELYPEVAPVMSDTVSISKPGLPALKKTFSHLGDNDDYTLCVCYFNGDTREKIEELSPVCSSCISLKDKLSGTKVLELEGNQLLEIKYASGAITINENTKQ